MARRKKPRVFVSHSSLDTPFASMLVTDLNASGAKAWMDVNDLGAGGFQEGIDEALADCEWFLLVLTRNALASEWVRMEVYAAIRLKNQRKIKQLIFIKAAVVEHTELPALWGVINIFDATQDYSFALNKTLRALGLKATIESAKGSQSNNLLDMSVAEMLDTGDALVEAGLDRLALPYFERVTQLRPTNEHAWENYAGTLWEAERFEEALTAYDKVLALNPINTSAWAFKAWIFLDLHRYEEAIQACDGAMAADPNDSNYGDAWSYKAEALRALGRTAEAHAVDQQAKELFREEQREMRDTK